MSRTISGYRAGLGALRDLQQTFAHPWVYLAELLQNAIDEKAKRIHIAGAGDGGLLFEHDGEPFTRDDVEALCQRGVSNKGPGTVGFMGVGFKATFCAFQRVKISSGPWRFALCVGVTKGEQFGEVRRDWLGAVQPEWDESALPPSGSMTSRFEFSERLADLQPIERDVERVFSGDFSLVALLAWRGLEELRWNGLEWMLNRVQRTLPGGKSGFEILEAWDLALDVVRRWVLFAVEYCPSQPAIARFLEHRQLPLAQESVEKFYEEASRARQVTAFVEIDPEDRPLLPERGSAYALLPTGISLPIGIHVHADWLLVISRRELIGLEDNQWQQEILQQIPQLLRLYVEWLTRTPREAGFPWPVAFAVFPGPLRADSPVDEWFGGESFSQLLRAELTTLSFLPAPPQEGIALRFLSPSDARVLPPLVAKAFDDGSTSQQALFGDQIISTRLLGERASEYLDRLKILSTIEPEELEAEWEKDRVRRWFGSLPEGERFEKLTRLLAALAALDGDPAWRAAHLRCLPTESSDWQPRAVLKRLPREWNVLAQEPELKNALEPFVGEKEQVLWWEYDGWLIRAERGEAKYLDEVPVATLEQVADAWWGTLQESPTQEEIELALRFTNWVRTKQPQRKVLVRKLLCEADGGSKRLLLARSAVLAEPFAGKHRRQLYPRLSLVSAEYLMLDSAVGETEWRAFFEGLPNGPVGPFNLARRSRLATRQELEQMGVEPPATRWGYITPILWRGTKIGHRDYAFSDALLPEPFQFEIHRQRGISPALARAAAQWMIEDPSRMRRELSSAKHVMLGYFPHGASSLRETALSRTASWWRDLSDLPWIPTSSDNAIRRPVDVLARPDPTRPDAPVADLPQELIAILEEGGIRFGAALPNAPAILRLRIEGPSADPSALLILLKEAIGEAGANDDKVAFLRRSLEECPLFPVLPGGPQPDAAARVPHGRLVRRMRPRSTFGGWLVPVEEFEQGSPIRQLFETLQAFHPIPAEATLQQALIFLRWVWQEEPEAERVRNALPRAYQYLREDLRIAPDSASILSACRGAAKVFLLRERRWERVEGSGKLFLDDIENPALTTVLRSLQLATPGHLGDTRQERLETARMLGLDLLSARYTVDVRPEGRLDTPGHWQQGFEYIQKRLRDRLAIDQGDQSAGDGQGDSETRPPLFLNRWQRIRIVVLDRGQEAQSAEAGAALCGGAIAVSGTPRECAKDVCRILFDSWGLRRRQDLVDLIPEVAIQLAQIGDAAMVTAWQTEDRGPTTEKPAPPEAPPPEDSEKESRERRINKPGVNPPTGEAEAAEPAIPGAGYTADDREARLKALRRRKAEVENQIKELSTLGILPEGEEPEPSDAEKAALQSDTRYRKAVLEYELRRGRWPIEKLGGQAGHDIDSFTHPEGDPGQRLVRRIEVKGTGAPWEVDHIVEMSDRQFNDAASLVVQEPLERAPDFDYWLYVVEETSPGHLQVLPIRNPARRAARFEVRAGTWRNLAEADEPAEGPGS